MTKTGSRNAIGLALRRLIAKVLGPVGRAAKAGSVADGLAEARGRPPRWLDEPGLGSAAAAPVAAAQKASSPRAPSKPAM